MIEKRSVRRIQEKKARLDALRPLPAASVRRLNEHLTIEWIFNSTAIEGNSLTLRETQLILETGITVGGKLLQAHLEVVNHRDAIYLTESWVRSQVPLTAFHVKQLHSLLLDKIDDENSGRYRTVQLCIAGSTHEPAPSWNIPGLMDKWVHLIQDHEGDKNPVAQSALAHHRLMAIHPFLDGNGRTARLVMNLILMRAGYPPAIINHVNRRQYYQGLCQADRGNPIPLMNLVGRAVERSLTLFLEALTPQTSPPDERDMWILLKEAAELVPYSQDYLAFLARTGRLEAIKRGQIWHTTRSALERYLASLNKSL